MKICVLGDGLLSKDFEKLNYCVINTHFLDFKIQYILNYDVIINTYDYKCEEDGSIDLVKMKKCNVDIPLLLSEFCQSRNKRYVHISTGELYRQGDVESVESAGIYARNEYTATKLLAESACRKKDLIIRTNNMFNSSCDRNNALFKAITNSTPSKNIESYSWTVDVVRGTVALLKNKQHGIFNITSREYISQAEICKEVGMENIAPTTDKKTSKYIRMNIDKLMKYIIPMSVMDNIPKCFEELRRELGE